MVLKAHLDPVAAVFDERRDARRAMQLETSGVLPGGTDANVIVHNLSAVGLLLETDLTLNAGEVLSIALPDVGPVDAAIVWQSEHLFGCAFTDALPEGALAAAQLHSLIDHNEPAGSLPFPSTPAEPFGVRLNRLRRERGLTLANVAASLEVSKPTVWAWEKGKARPLPERIEAIASALDVSIDELSDSRDGDKGRSVIEDARLRIATTYGADPRSIRIMIEV
ncbi:helix-turn-helix domain-containing protein [Erythrobacter crassostreae]|uniref:Helix-turn-helix domain-containing protein n=1 Tax=Erythrobacter crassostreae TaxID=2828328 RepID=A0A9X1F1I6_9SPHN|nr:helix-turn-helix domain-containing protein [Erythrobacter crassostrea]MBV7258306.1 helix-turn-helix domain-containing protein [Erythrobacter crassostrea]